MAAQKRPHSADAARWGMRVQLDMTIYGSPAAIRRAMKRIADKTYVDGLEAAIARRLLRSR